MSYEGEKDGKEVVVVHERVVSVHKCPKCGTSFSVFALFLKDEDEYGNDCWEELPQTPNYCYMCGACMDSGVAEE